jgi:hypothetical protein
MRFVSAPFVHLRVFKHGGSFFLFVFTYSDYLKPSRGRQIPVEVLGKFLSSVDAEQVIHKCLLHPEAINPFPMTADLIIRPDLYA